MRKNNILFLLFLSLIFFACSSEKKEEGKKSEVTAKAQSAPYELLLVANKDWLKTETGKAVKDMVETPVEVLPQSEPSFRVTTIEPRSFDGVFRLYSNIVIVDVDKKYTKPEVRKAVNQYARPQTIIYMCSPDNAGLMTLVQESSQFVLGEFNKNEFAREVAGLSKKYSGNVMRQAKKQFGLEIKAPEDVDDIKEGKDFFWAAASKRAFRQNVCIYTLPLQHMTLEMMVAARDSIMKINIPGDREDQWMETDSRTVLPDVVNFNTQTVAVMRGLWGMRHDAMGGPFVSYYFPDSVNNRIIVAEGFVCAPEEKKKPIMRQLEAALQTLVKSDSK